MIKFSWILIETEIEDAGDCRERRHGALAKISTFFEKQSKAEQAVASVNQQPVSAVQQNEMGASGQLIRLPKLQLKKFSGDPKLWQEWWDSFEATVHVNVQISNVEKLILICAVYWRRRHIRQLQVCN